MIRSHDLSTLFHSTRREAQSLLPQLVRRLIFASCPDSEVPNFEMPAGDDIRLHGWDGTLGFSGVHPYIPTGSSVWEMGVSADPEPKANDDYDKRTKNPRGVVPSSTTFVFVTPHVWAGREKWVDDKCANGIWRDVQAIDGSVLATWLERAPAVALWVADALGRPIRGLHSLDQYWNSAIAHRYAPNISPSLIVGGREGAREQLIEFFQSPSRVISVVGETAEEAALFAAAVCKESFTSEKRSRLFVLSEPTATEHLAALAQEHIVILTEPSLYPLVRPDSSDHLHFVLPEKRNARTSTSRMTDSIHLDTLVRKTTAAALHEMGLAVEEADRIAGDSRGSLYAVLLMIAQPERGALDWASGRTATELAPLVFAGQWTINDTPDHEVIAGLAQRPYSEIRQVLAEWSGPGKPLERRGSTWDWKAWGFAWRRLAPTLQHDDVDRFLKIAKEVLGAVDPALEAPPEDCWLVHIRGEVNRHSAALRQGLAQSIVLLAMNGDLLPDLNGQAAAHSFVESLLQVPDPASRWISIASWLPDLAEAVPDAFLDSLDRLTDDPAAVMDLFTERGMFGSSSHTQVLWALERLAWSRDHLGRVVLAFARLAALDPGGSLVNRPSRSLRMILLPWYPATGAAVTDRVNALRLLFQHVGPTAWQCAASLLPRPHDRGQQFARPRWRTWAKETSPAVTVRDYWVFQEELVDLLLKHTEQDGNRWAQLLRSAPELSEKNPELGSKIVNAIRDLDPAQLKREDARILGEAARSLVMHHESMQESGWAMKGEALKTFKRLRDHLLPSVRRDRDRWLFTQWPEVPREFDISLDERSEQLRTLRAASIAAVLEEEGYEAVLAWAREVDNPESLGCALAEQELAPAHERDLLDVGLDVVGTTAGRPPLARLAYGYVYAKSRTVGKSWRDMVLSNVCENLTAPAIAFFLQALSTSEQTWELLERQDEEVRTTYWRQIGINFLELKECEVAVPQLLVANRPFKAINLIAMLVYELKKNDRPDKEHERIAALARTVLDAEIDHLPSDEHTVSSSTSYRVDEVLNYLESRGASRADLGRWEWHWLPFIWDGRRKLKALQDELSETPDLFVELLKCVYRPESGVETEQEPSDEDQSRAHQAYRLLEAWTRTPGLRPDAQYHDNDALGEGLGPICPAWSGGIDEAVLTEWVRRATDLASAADRTGMCNQHIGRQFAYAPAGNNGSWPSAEICRAIERARNDDLERGMIIGVLNRRGVHWVTRDGTQENAMANRFREWCELVRLEYPRTGAVLRRLAESYEIEAKREIERGRLEEFHD